MSTPSDNAIRAKMEKLVAKVDLETMTTKQFIALLSQKMGGADLSSKKKFIKANITEILDEMAGEKSEESSSESSSEEEDEESSLSSESEKEKPKKKRQSGLTAVKEISPEMASFLGKSQKEAARTEVVKGLWDYIKAHSLQNPNDKREILFDDRMQSLFHAKKCTMFQLNKYVGAHIHPFKPVDLSTNSASTTAAGKKRSTPASRLKAKRGAEAKKARKQGGQAPYRLSDALSRVVGKDILPRPQVTQALWVYIKKHDLQNPNDKREILCDDLLKKVMGGKSKVTMFSMNKFITPHMIEKVDKSEYTHEDAEKSSSSSDSGGDSSEEEAEEESESGEEESEEEDSD